MAYAATTTRFVLSGLMPGGEEWSCGFAMGGLAEEDEAAFIIVAQTVDAAWRTAWGSMDDYIGSGVKFHATDGYYYATGTTATLHVRVEGTDLAGGTAAGVHPNQCAVVCSLLTQLPGRYAKGRMYLPCQAVSVDGTDHMLNAATDTIAAAMATFFTSLNSDLSPGIVVVASQARGANYAVNQVAVDNVYDTQRRRRDSVSPTHTATGIVG